MTHQGGTKGAKDVHNKALTLGEAVGAEKTVLGQSAVSDFGDVSQKGNFR
jgi:hypothetical protein